MKNSSIHIVWYFLFFVFSYLNTSAQPVVKAAVDRTSIRTGEPIRLKLTAAWPGRSTLINGFTIPDSIAHFDIWDQQNPLIIKNGIEQLITLTSYDSGQYAIPAFILNLSDSSEKSYDYRTDSIRITVTPVNVDTMREYHDIKDIIGVPPILQWPYMAAIAAVTFISLIAVILLLRKTHAVKKEKQVFIPRGNPYQTAVKKLDSLEEDFNSHLSGNNIGQPYSKHFFTQLSDIYRTYLEEAYNFRSLRQSGDELILQAKSLLEQDLFFQFAITIRLCDAAKFAKYEPPADDWNQSIKTVRKTIWLLDEKGIG